MPITLGEFDVDFPIAVPDEFLVDEGVDLSKVGHCNYQVGLAGFRIVPLYMEMYSTIYGVRRDPARYLDVVRELEEGLQNFLDNLPDELRIEKRGTGEQLFALYTQAFSLEFTLCLRHPSVCMTDDAKFCAENTRICEETARKLLKVVEALLKVKCLDTTWYQLSVYVAAIFSMLVAHWERRFDISAPEIATLREEMGSWLEVIREIGRLLGTGNGITGEVNNIILRTITWIENDMGRNSGVEQPLIKQQQSESPFPPSFSPKPGQANNATGEVSANPTAEQRATGTSNGNGYYDAAVGDAAAPYPPSLTYDAQTASGSGGTQAANGVGGAAAYNATSAGAAAAAAAAAAAYMYGAGGSVSVPSAVGVEGVSAAANPLIAFASQATQHVAGQGMGDEWRPQMAAATTPVSGGSLIAGNNTWHDWTAAIADSQDRYSASALLTLGAGLDPSGPRDMSGGGGGGAQAPGAMDQSAMVVVPSSHSQQWPLLLFHDGTGGSVGGP